MFCHSALQDVHLLTVIRESKLRGSSFRGLVSLLAPSLHFVLLNICIYHHWRQVNKVESICVQWTCVLFIDNIILSIFICHIFLLVWVIECLITGLKLKMAYLWLQSLMQSIDFKSFSHYLFNDCVSMYKHMLSLMFLDSKNSSKCEIHTCLQISCNQGWGNIAWDPFPFSSPQFYNLNMVSKVSPY